MSRLDAVDRDELGRRIDRLEGELRTLRRRLHRPPAKLPIEPFHVLAIRPAETWYGIRILSIREVLPILWCDPLPESPAWVLGTFRYGSATVPMIDLCHRLEGATGELDPSMCTVVIEIAEGTDGLGGGEEKRLSRLLGLAVREIGELHRVEPSQVTPPSDVPQAPFLLGSANVIDRELRLLDLDCLVEPHGPDGYHVALSADDPGSSTDAPDHEAAAQPM